MTPRRADAGVTLVEMLVALVLFALIGGAGFGMLDQILRTQTGTEERLERLAQLQRGMYLISTDFAQARNASLSVEDSDTGPRLSIARNAAETGAGWTLLTYRVEDGVLWRDVALPSGVPIAVQPLITGVAGVVWQFRDPDMEWVDQWPPAGQVASLAPTDPNPGAVQAVITLTDARQLRRVAALPAEPQ